MVSSKLTTRRQTVARPKICKPSPIPLPPPVPPWPPDSFNLHFTSEYWINSEPQYFEHTYELIRQPDSWDWKDGTITGAPCTAALWRVRTEVQQAELEIQADDSGVQIIAAVDVVEVVWDTPTEYEITLWDMLQPPHQNAVADFTF